MSKDDKVNIAIRVDRSFKELLDQRAAQERRPVAWLVRDFVERGMQCNYVPSEETMILLEVIARHTKVPPEWHIGEAVDQYVRDPRWHEFLVEQPDTDNVTPIGTGR